jgi:hypothetical protein
MDDNDSNSTGRPPSSCLPSSEAIAIRRRPIPRKGHKKSRGGCGRCKRRKVKCDEATPICGQCSRLGFQCDFESSASGGGLRKSGRQAVALSASVPQPLRSSPGNFSLTDLRFFQHFLLNAYPPFPLGGREIWRHVSQLSHHVGIRN